MEKVLEATEQLKSEVSSFFYFIFKLTYNKCTYLWSTQCVSLHKVYSDQTRLINMFIPSFIICLCWQCSKLSLLAFENM